MEKRKIISNSPSGTKIAESQGSQSQSVPVEVTVLRAHNVPHIKTMSGGKREYFVTIAYRAPKKKTTKTKGVQIVGQMVVWNQRLDGFLVQSSSQLVLCLYAKRLSQSDLLIGTHQITVPVKSETNISFVLSHGHGQAVQPTEPVTLYLSIAVSTNSTSPTDSPKIPTEGDEPPAPLLPLSDHLLVQSSAPMPQDLAETSLVKRARGDLDRADEVNESINRSNTWEGAVRKIKWVMDTLSPVAELHPIAQMAYRVLSVIPEELSRQYQRDDNIRTLLKSMHDAFDFAIHEDTLKSIEPKSKQAEILTLMLQDVCSCSDFIKSYTKDSKFLTRTLKNMGSGVGEKIQDLSTALIEHRRAFLDHAVVTAEVTAFQILNTVGKISSQLQWVSSQISDAALDAKIGEIPYRRGSRFTPTKGCLRGTRIPFLDFIVDWVNNPASERSLVLFGLAGTGKSSIAHEVARRFDETGRLTSSFIFVRKEQFKTEAYHLFTNLARDLADRYPLFKTALGRVIRDDTALRLGARDYGTLFRRLIQEPLKDLYIVGPILVVIDALDESGDATGENGLHRFLAKNLSELPSNFRVLITSRPEDGIESAFLAAKSVIIRHMNDYELGTTTRYDILTFIRKRLPSDDFERYGEALARKAEGLFQWAAVACGYIREPKPVRSRKGRIEHLLTSTAGHHGQDPLNELYKEVLEEYFTDEEARGLFRSVVGQLLAAFEPLSIRSLTTLRQHASNLNDDDDSSVVETLRYLGSLLSNATSSDDNLPILPLHTSFRDFVTNEEKSGVFYVDLGFAHCQLAHSCLSLALHGLKFNICGLESSYLANKDVEDLEVRIFKYLPPALSYACRFWVNHLEHLDFEVDLFGKLETFFEKKFLFWLEALSLMSDVGLASPALSYLNSWIASGQGQVSQAELERIRSFINDASVFVRYFGMAMVKSAPHIYISALPFAPTDSIVSARYSGSFPRTLHVERGRLSHWPSSEIVISNGGSSIALSPDGRRIVSGSFDGTVRVWSATTGDMVAGPFTHTPRVKSVAFSPDGQRIVSGSFDLIIWNAMTGDMVAGPFTGHTNWVTSVSFSPDGQRIISASFDRTIRVWNAMTGDTVAGPFTCHTLMSVAFSPDCLRIVSGSDDRTLRVWSATTGDTLAGPFSTGHTSIVLSAAFSPGGQRIVSGSHDGTIHVWSATTGDALAGPFTGHTRSVWSVAFSPDGQRIVSGSYDRTIRVWNAVTGDTVAGPFTGHTDSVSCVAFSPDGQRTISGSDDQTIRVWNTTIGDTVVGTFTRHSHLIWSVAFSPDGQRTVSGSNDGTICVWNTTTGETVAGPFTGHVARSTRSHVSVKSVAFSPDGRWIVSGSEDQTARVWNATTGDPVAGPYTKHRDSVTSVRFSPDGQLVISASSDSTICVWNATTGETVVGPFTGHTLSVLSVAFSPDGQRVVSGSKDRTIRVWDATTGNTVADPFTGHTDSVTSVAFSPDGEWIVSGSEDRTIRVWNITTGDTVVGPLSGHAGSVDSVSFSPDGQWIVSGSEDGTIRVWNAMTGDTVAGPLTGHVPLVLAVAFSSDGRWIISGSDDEIIRVWDITMGNTVETSFPDLTHTHAIASVRFPRVVSSGEVDFTDQSVINDDGWICGNEGELLMWIPPVHRARLHRPRNIWVAGEYETRLDLSNFVHGRSWMSCTDS